MVGEQALEVVLAEGEGDAEDARDDPEGEKGEPQRAAGRGKSERTRSEAVDARLDDDPRHQGGDVAGRRGVRAREPDVERHEAGLEAEAREREDRTARRRGGVRRQRRQGEPPWSRQHREEGERSEGAGVRRRQVDPAGGAPGRLPSVATRKYEASAITSQATRKRWRSAPRRRRRSLRS